MQIRAKLTIQFIALVAGILLLALLFIYVRYAQLMEEEFYRGLHSKAVMTAEMVLREEDRLRVPEEKTASKNTHIPVSDVISIFNQQGRRVFAINPLDEPIPGSTFSSIMRDRECRFQYANLLALGLVHETRSGNEYVVVAGSVFQSQELRRLRGILTGSFLTVIGLVALGGWFFAGRAMSPVARVVNEVDHLLPSHLGNRLQEPESNDEIGRLVATFNRMLDRLYFAFQMQKRFISNISHELRNPISVIISQLEVALEDPNANKQDYKDAMKSVLDDSRNMALMTERLLQMARVYSEDAGIPFSPIRLDEVALQAQDGVLRAYPGYAIHLGIEGEVDSEEALTLSGNEALLRLALLNLMENACKFSPDKEATVTIIPTEHRIVLEVKDNGPGIPTADIGLIFQPFYRGAQQTKTPGTGIGLSLVDSILRLHQATVEVESELERGTTFRLVFNKTL